MNGMSLVSGVLAPKLAVEELKYVPESSPYKSQMGASHVKGPIKNREIVLFRRNVQVYYTNICRGFNDYDKQIKYVKQTA